MIEAGPSSALIESARAGDGSALSELVEELMPLVKRIAGNFAGSGAEYEELVQTGAVGLVKAIRGYDPDCGALLTTYAFYAIEGEIRHFLRDCGLVRMRGRQAELARKAEEIIREEQNKGESPRIEALALRLGVSAGELACAMAAAEPVLSLQDTQGGGRPLGEGLSSGTDHEEECVDRLFLSELLCSLPRLERELIELRFREELKQSEIAKRLGLSQGQVSKLEKRIIEKLGKEAKAD